MAHRIGGLALAIFYDLKQKYELHALLENLARDPRLLEDCGLTLAEVRAANRQAQRDQSPLRQYLMSRKLPAQKRQNDMRIARPFSGP
jgi:hypothetical protein